MASLGDDGANASLNGIKDAIDGGSGAGYLEIGTTAFASILATLPLSDPCGSVASRTLTFTTPFSDTSADASGTAASVRIKNSDGDIIISAMTIGITGSGQEVILNAASLAITAGQPITISSATLSYS